MAMLSGFLRVSLLSAACLATLPSFAMAASFYIQEQSVSGLGTAFAGAAADTQDSSTVFYNPAGMTELPRMEMQAGVNVLLPDAKFRNAGSTGGAISAPIPGTNSDNPFEVSAVPNLFFSVPVADHPIWFGVAVTAPFGLANEFDKDFVGRYNSSQSELAVIDIAPSVAWKAADWLSIGGGINIQHADAHLENAIPAPGVAQTTSTDGLADLSGDDVSVGYNLGVLVKPIDGTKIGLHYKQGVSHTLEGRLINRLPISGALGVLSGTSSRVGGSAELDLPDIASLGVSQKVGDDWTLLGSLNYYKWSNFGDIPVRLDNGLSSSTKQGYEDTWGFAIGTRYQVNERLQLKAGFQYDPTPTVDQFRSTRIPDGDRKWFSAGVSYDLNENLSLDLSGTYVDLSKEKINIRDVSPVANTVTVTRGTTEGNVGIVSGAIRYRF